MGRNIPLCWCCLGEGALLHLNPLEVLCSFACGHVGETAAVSGLLAVSAESSYCAVLLPPFSENETMPIVLRVFPGRVIR